LSFAKFGPEFLVNSTTTSFQSESSVTALADGRFVVTWSDNSEAAGKGDESLSAVRGQIFSAFGAKSTVEFLVNTNTEGNQIQSSVVALADGRFVVTWSDRSEVAGSADTDGYAVRGQIFGTDGTKSGGEFLVNTLTAYNQVDSSVTALAVGRFVVTWSDNSEATGSGDESGNAVRGQVFDADGAKSGGEFLVNTNTEGSQAESSVTALTDGRFVVTWSDRSEAAGSGDTSSSSVRGQIFGADGTKSGGEFLVNTLTANDQIESSVTALDDGCFVVTWTDYSMAAGSGDTSDYAVRGQIFGADGIKSGGEFLVNTFTANDQIESSVTALADGRFVVTWSDYSEATGSGDTSFYAVRGQIFGADGAKSGGEFLVNTITADDQTESSVAALLDGRFVVTWTDRSAAAGSGDTSDNAIRSQIFDPLTYNGDATDETVIGGNFVDRIFGYGGVDKISGGKGTDTLSGGTGGDVLNGDDGADRIDGGDGNDLIIGGAGADVLRGGTGNDAYFVESRSDKVIEAKNAGVDTVNAAFSFILSSNVEKLVLGGTGNFFGTGNAVNNTLSGNGGKNSLSGLAGNDTLLGGKGNDKLDGGADKDLLTGGLGNDTFVFKSALNASTNIDRITDYNVRADTISLENSFFKALTKTGRLAEDAFHAIKTGDAIEGDDRIIYNKSTGALSYDADGDGAIIAVRFATLSKGLALTHLDFIVS
jgi:Ca2+-binding RTX toxin-like protein